MLKRLIIALVSLLIAIIFAFPTIALIIGIFLIYQAKWVSLIFCCLFAWNIGKLVESKYIKFLGKSESEIKTNT